MNVDTEKSREVVDVDLLCVQMKGSKADRFKVFYQDVDELRKDVGVILKEVFAKNARS